MFEDVTKCNVKFMTFAQEYLFQCHNNGPPDRLQREYTGGHV